MILPTHFKVPFSHKTVFKKHVDRSILHVVMCNMNRHDLGWFILHNHATLSKLSQTYRLIQAQKLDYTLYQLLEKCTTVTRVLYT